MESGNRPSLHQRFEQFQPSKTALLWSCVACVIVTMVIGFSWGGWVTGGTAQEMAQDSAEEARVQVAAAVCIDRFMTAANVRGQLSQLKEISSSYQRGEFVEDGGWAKMPGSEDQPIDAAAELCAEQLVERELPIAQEASTINENATVAQ